MPTHDPPARAEQMELFQPDDTTDRERLMRLELYLSGLGRDFRLFVSETRAHRTEQSGQQQIQERRLERLDHIIMGPSPDQPGLAGQLRELSSDMKKVKDAILTAKVGWKAAALIGGAATTIAAGILGVMSYFGFHVSVKP